MILWLLNLIVFVSAKNISETPVLPNEGNINLNDISFTEGAIGGMIPTALIILLAAIVRIIQLYKQRKQYKNNLNRKPPLETYV